jgi:pimeloyl-ACP methyl ester carboxylesterase
MPSFRHEGHRLAYTVYGEGPRTTVLVHGLLLSQKMHLPLARALADRGNRIVTLDLLGHGKSDRPRDMTKYSMTFFGEQILALMDHLELDEAVIAGTSLGANATLEAAAKAPERVLSFGAKPMRGLAKGLRLVPSRRVFWLDVALDWLRQDPEPSAAVLHGLFFGRVAPHKEIRRTLEAPALVIGHHRDPVHPFSDSDALVAELPNARLLKADSMLELRIAPERLTNEIADFLDECWRPRRRGDGAGRRAA